MTLDAGTAPKSATSPYAPLSPRRRNLLAGFAGIASALVTLGVAGVIAVFFGLANPVVAVGSLVIDLVPPGVKTLVIDLFGTGDKAVLLIVLGVIVVIAAVAVGILQARKPPLGIALLCLIGFLALVAALTRASASVTDLLPTPVGVVVGILVLRVLIRRLEAWRAASEREPSAARRVSTTPYDPAALERRSFLQFAIGSSAIGLVAGIGAQLVGGAATVVADVRSKIKLPAAASPAPVIPADAMLDVKGISPYIVPAADFYRIDTALAVPSINPDSWSLKITGMVENEIEITWAELLKLPMQERIITLACVSQEVGGDLIGNAEWLGYPIRELLARAKPTAGADMVLSTSIDGFTAGTPLTVLQDEKRDSLLAIGMNGKPLPIEHGFPARMVVPGLYGYVSATKWVVEMRVTTFAKDQGYWTPRGWSALGPIKLSSRIDTPQNGFAVKSGDTVAIAGVAWAQHTGISKVEVQVDDGGWQQATLAKTVTVDSWLQWSMPWKATAGSHTVAVRATDLNGLVQTAKLADPAPNGSTGLHTIAVNGN